jgi:phosphoglycerate dehydrogenase-like enzyme
MAIVAGGELLAVILARLDSRTMTRPRCAILDDYLNLALNAADWTAIADRVDLTVINQPFASETSAAYALKDFEIICAMRERTPFPRTLFAALPTLKLLITSGLRNAAIDLEAARDHKVVLCGTQFARDPTAPLTMGLILELTRNIGRERARMHAGAPLQGHVGIEIEGRTLGVIGLGKLGSKVSKLAQAFGMNVVAWSPNLRPEKCKEVGVTYATKEELLSGGTMARIGLRMMPPFPSSPLRCRTAGFPSVRLLQSWLVRQGLP